MDILFFSSRSSNSKLFHHFQKFASIILEKVVGDRQNASWFSVSPNSVRNRLLTFDRRQTSSKCQEILCTLGTRSSSLDWGFTTLARSRWLVLDIITHLCVIRVHLLFPVLIVVVIFRFLFIQIFSTSFSLVVFRGSFRCAMIEFDYLTRSVNFYATWEGPSARWCRLTTMSCSLLVCGVYQKLLVILLIQRIEFHFDIDLFATTDGTSTSMSMLFLHLLDHCILFNLHQITSFRIGKTEPESRHVLSVFG